MGTKVIRVDSNLPAGMAKWEITHDGGGTSFFSFIGEDLSATDLRTIAAQMEEDELRKLRIVWAEQAQKAWVVFIGGHHGQAEPNFVDGYVVAHEEIYKTQGA